MERRKFIKSSASAAAATALPIQLFSAGTSNTAERKFRICLNPGTIGVRASLQESLDYAIKYGYESIVSSPKELMGYSSGQIDELNAKMKENNIGWGSTNIPVEYRQGKTKFHEDFKGLREHCKALEKVGATRMNTWIISTHNELTYNENMKQHAYRLGECVRVMKDYGISLGLEYLGMRTLMTMGRYPFIGSMKEGKELIEEIGESNVGFVLDSFHWYTANDTIDDIRSLTPEDIITVDLNDARSGFKRVDQQDGKRELPLVTGVINLKDFLQGLIDIGYDGPVRTEPFNQVLNDMENDEALKINMEAIKKSLALVGL
ncbi:sugar phosphate isomerase/epimerase [Saonia flava]|uniref:Sugar phosphate isomerase/epimerase n=1 Tax=Saonia flava TaxID=523696 RepID=A0A846R4V0_9FLAO|nr:sugar phosphate isomerase/epimerase family protein [Saonia flava]NJB72404.1 sugar phosphate isomerase/epimerase [Saonia flava]